MDQIDAKGSSFHRILTIAKNTFRESVRDRILYNLVLFVLLITACAILLSDLTDGQEARTIVNIGLSAMLVFGVFIAIFVGVGLVSKEIEKRTVYAIFSKPVHRGEFVIGKFLGLCVTLFVNTAVMGLGISLALLFVGGGTMAGTIWGAVALIYIELAIITAVAIVFSSFSSPALSALLTFIVFIIGHLSASLREFAASLGSTFARAILEAGYYILPNLSLFAFRTEAANSMVPSPVMVFGGLAYGAAYAAVLLSIAIVILGRRDFK
jgi:Cu-processing system permease protein